MTAAQGRQPHRSIRYRLAFLAWLLFVAWGLVACESAPVATPSPAPTFTLVPAPATATRAPTLRPTATLTNLPSAAEIAQTRAARNAPAAPDASAVIALALADAAQRADSPPGLLEHERVTWRSPALDCEPLPARATPAPVEGFRLLVLAQPTVYVYHTDARETVRLCDTGDLYDDYPDLYTRLDPVAAEFVLLAQARLARDLDLPADRLRLSSVRPVVWADRQLECATADQPIDPIPTQGYRIAFTADDDRLYVFHTDFGALVILCETP